MRGCAAQGYCSCALHHCLVLPPSPAGWPGTTSIVHRSCPARMYSAGAAMSKYTLGRVAISSANVCVSAVKRHLPCYGHSTTAIAAYIYTSNASVIQALFCTNIGGIWGGIVGAGECRFVLREIEGRAEGGGDASWRARIRPGFPGFRPRIKYGAGSAPE